MERSYDRSRNSCADADPFVDLEFVGAGDAGVRWLWGSRGHRMSSEHGDPGSPMKKKSKRKKRKKTKGAKKKAPRRRRPPRVRPIVGPYQIELPLQMPLFPLSSPPVSTLEPE
jgi:hypothetical protein